jgi:formyl-CoA transferase
MDGIVQAYAGMDVLTADGPVHPGEPYVDYAAALILSWAIAAALYHRERTGRGQRVATSLFQAAMVLQNNSLNSVEVADSDRRERLAALASAVASGADWREVMALREGGRGAGPARPYNGLFRTADGVIAIAGGGRGSQRRMLDLLGLEDDWLLDPSRPPADPRAYVRERRRLVEELMRRRTTAQWLKALAAEGIPCAPFQLKEQVLEDEQAWENGYLLKMRHEDLGELTLVAPPARFSETPLAPGPPPPRLGAHTEEVLRETGLSREAVERLRGLGAVR